ncbi:MAG TPA: beta-ketoacyl-ACP synthase II [Limnochordia bacterium]|nr:beta-ketoacyl-ACP synthase II [Limnochordia bacterium]
MSKAHRVVITGVGLITPTGVGAEATWKAILSGQSGIGPITHFDASEMPVRIAGEVKGFDPESVFERKDARHTDPFVHFGMAAALEAAADAGLEDFRRFGDRAGVIMGSGMGGLGTILENYRALSERGWKRVSPFFVPATSINLLPGQISIRLGVLGPNFSAVSACSTGNHNLGQAFRLIQSGEADAMITGGSEAVITDLCVAGFAAARALSTRNDEPARASRPFDLNRDGFVVGEGAGALVLESLASAEARGAHIYGEIIGFGMSADAYHITAPAEDGDGALRAMHAALRDAELDADALDYVNAHGTSTGAGDAAEAAAICRLLGDKRPRLPVSSTKSMTGHLLGAAGAVEAAFCALALRDQVMPPTINYDEPDPACPLDVVPNEARRAKIDVAMSNAFGFGGTNTSLIMRRI